MRKNILLIAVLSLSLVQLTSCSNNTKDMNQVTYKVKKSIPPIALNGDWNSSQWEHADILELKNYMGDKPEHFPKTQAMLLYDDKNIYVFFRVEDRYVRAVAEKTHDSVYSDSCVEFFFTPSEGLSKSYFNLEINCGGTVLMYYCDEKMATRTPLDVADCQMIEIFHSMPKIIEPEIAEPTPWVLQYKLPLEMLNKYHSIDKPEPGVKWRANFYKCADKTSHPHWLTWATVDNPTPNFHLPQYFGIIEFE